MMDYNLHKRGMWQLPHRLAGHRHMRHAWGQGMSGKAGNVANGVRGERQPGCLALTLY